MPIFWQKIDIVCTDVYMILIFPHISVYHRDIQHICSAYSLSLSVVGLLGPSRDASNRFHAGHPGQKHSGIAAIAEDVFSIFLRNGMCTSSLTLHRHGMDRNWAPKKISFTGSFLVLLVGFVGPFQKAATSRGCPSGAGHHPRRNAERRQRRPGDLGICQGSGDGE